MSAMPCNFCRMKSNPYNVVITADRWDHDGATLTQGTITIDDKVVEWYLGPPLSGKDSTTPVFIDGKNETNNPLATEIEDALAERHCPETSDGRIGADYGDDGCCPVCAARHELAVYNTVQILSKGCLKVKMARVNEDGTEKKQ